MLRFTIHIIVALGFLLAANAQTRRPDPMRSLWVAPGEVVGTHFADGQDWSTEFVFVNLEDTPRQATIYFRGSNGNRAYLDIKGYGQGFSIPLNLPGNGSVRLETSGTGSTLTQGWAFVLDDDDNTTPLGSSAVFRWARPGFPVYEAVVPFGNLLDSKLTMPFDHRNGYRTGVAIANTDTRDTAQVSLTFYGENGFPIARESLSLGPVNHTSFLLTERYPELVGQVGSVELRSANHISVLGLRFHPGGAFTTVFPMRLLTDVLDEFGE